MSIKGQQYDVDKNGIGGYKGLAVAVIAQAAEDWRNLCDGATETRDSNFIELEDFFKNEAKIYCGCSVMQPKQMLKILLREKAEKYHLDRKFTI